jgi:hypothetical protein
MAIKVEVKDTRINKKVEYPFLGKSKKHLGFIVFFTSQYEGTVLSPGNNEWHEIGYYSAEWDMECFEKFHGEITLSND